MTSSTDTLGRLRPRLPYTPLKPTPHQAAFLVLPHQEALYGGAAGGGKTVALLMAALMYMNVPGYSALLLRRTYPELSGPGGLMTLSREWLTSTDAVWSGSRYQWTFPSGATLTFGHLARDADMYKYQGHEYQFIGFDEATHFTERQYTYLMSRLRRVVKLPVPLRMRCASNPGGQGHVWVRERFVTATKSGDMTRPFIRSLLQDNPHLDRELYAATLQHLHPVDRDRLLCGDWDVKDGGRDFDLTKVQMLAASLVPAGCKWVRAWDLAGSEPSSSYPDPDYTAGALIGRIGQSTFLQDMVTARKSPGRVLQLVVRTAEEDGKNVPIFIEREPGQSGLHQALEYQRALVGYQVQFVSPSGDKRTRSIGFANSIDRGTFNVVNTGAWVDDFMQEIDDGFDHGHDDQIDAVSLGWYGLDEVNVIDAIHARRRILRMFH